MSGPVLRAATPADVGIFYPVLPYSMRGLAADLGGRCIGVAGITITPMGRTLFATITDELRAYPLTMARAGRRIMTMAGTAPLTAIADPAHPRSGAFLEWLGFVRVGERPEGEVYLR